MRKVGVFSVFETTKTTEDCFEADHCRIDPHIGSSSHGTAGSFMASGYDESYLGAVPQSRFTYYCRKCFSRFVGVDFPPKLVLIPTYLPAGKDRFTVVDYVRI